MEREELKTVFEKFDKDFLSFKMVENKTSTRADMHAFMLLDKLVPPVKGGDIIGSAEHDEIWLNVDLDELAKVATEEDIHILVQCGIRYDDDVDSLAMFV